LDWLYPQTGKYFDTEQSLFQDSEKVKKGFQFGNITLPDGKNIALFDVEVSDTVNISKNRKGLRDIAIQYIDNGIINAALVVFHSSSKPLDFRLSFIAKQAGFTDDGDFVTTQTAPKRYTFILGKNESCTTAAKRLLELKEKAPIGGLGTLIDAFSVEKLNKEFFKGYKEHYEKFWKYINSQTECRNVLIDSEQTDISKTEKPIRDFAKKLLGRIVFLYFLQKKGWMGSPLTDTSDRLRGETKNWQGGDPNFIKNLFLDFPNKPQFYSQVLTQLFFETLNTKRQNDVFTPIGGRRAGLVPYLNGGLFDNDQPETNHFDFPENYFAELFEFFDQFNFTIDENSPEDANVGIDPEMLGHIFENLLEENKDKGAFYTPKAIVQYMCQESLIQYLETHLLSGENHSLSNAEGSISTLIRYNDRGDAKGFVTKNARRIEELLDNVKICDPAIGSGAFPMGMLQEIFKAKMTLDLTLDPAETKRHIIQNSIYGVDLERGAVDIARLRFWLALVVDEDTPSPLPNLDYKIMQGNSLLESFEGVPLHNVMAQQGGVPPTHMEFLDNKQQDLDNLIDSFFDIDSQHKPAIKQQINDIVHEHLHYNVDLKLAEVETKIATLEDELALINFNENDPKAKREQKQKALAIKQKAIQNLQQEQQRLQNALLTLDRIQETNDRPYFLWHLFFKDVFEQGGFDIVIGNPPYVGISKLQDKAVLEKQGFKTIESTGDIYSLFYELGNNLLKIKGNLCFITSNKWLRASYGKSLRKYFIENTNPVQLIDFGQTMIFETAIVHSNIFIFHKDKNLKNLQAVQFEQDLYKNNLSIENYFEKHNTTISDFDESIWTIASDNLQNIRNKAEKIGKPLKEWDLKINFGIKTGYNEAFIIDENTKNDLIQQDANNAEIIKPILRGRDVRKYHCNFANWWLINTHNGIRQQNIMRINVEKDYPIIFNYLSSFLPKVKERFDKGEHWTNLRNCAYIDEFTKPKIVFSEIVSEAQFHYDELGYYPEATVFFMTGENLKYLIALLNSKPVTYIFKTFYAGGELVGKFRYKKAFLENLPIPQITSEAQKPFETLVNQILENKKEGKDTVFLEGEIDRLVYQLYELTEAEIAVVEGR
jgi:hypothetical protein